MTLDIACEWTLVTEPVGIVIPVDDAKKHAAIVANDEDDLIRSYIFAATQAAESYLNTGILTQTWKAQFSEFGEVMYLPMAGRLQNDAIANPSTAPVVQYYDINGTLQTLATTYYTVDTTSTPGAIVRAPNQTWPSVQPDRARPVIITYVCGYLSPDDVPETIKQGIRLYVGLADADRLGDAATMTRKAAESCWNAAGPVYWRPPTCLW